MIAFPQSTLVGKPVPKTAFYRNLEVNAKVKQRFVDDVASITWTAKIAPSTLNVTDGKDVHEIVVFHIVLKAEDTPDDVFLTIDRQMPRHVVFLLQNEERYREHKEFQEKRNVQHISEGLIAISKKQTVLLFTVRQQMLKIFLSAYIQPLTKRRSPN